MKLGPNIVESGFVFPLFLDPLVDVFDCVQQLEPRTKRRSLNPGAAIAAMISSAGIRPCCHPEPRRRFVRTNSLTVAPRPSETGIPSIHRGVRGVGWDPGWIEMSTTVFEHLAPCPQNGT
jgi:hypothetical protein